MNNKIRKFLLFCKEGWFIILMFALMIFAITVHFIKTPQATASIKWEYINGERPFYRTRIYGGWLIQPSYTSGATITFIPLNNPDGWTIK